MRIPSSLYPLVATVALTGCVSYPVYQPVPVARLTPAQSASLASQPLDPAQRDAYAAANAQVQREDQADLDAQRRAEIVQSYSYAYPAPLYAAPIYAAPSYGYYGYPGPYYGGYSPWYPGLSLSLGFSNRGYGGYRGGYRGGHRGGWHGGGGFRGRR